MRMMRVKASVVAACVVTQGIVFAVSSGAGLDLQSASAVWLFDDGAGNTAKDLTGNGNDGELIQGPKWVDGKFGGALEFAGGYVVVEEPVGLPLLWEPRTVMAWFQLARVEEGRKNELMGFGPFNSPGWFGAVIAGGDPQGVDLGGGKTSGVGHDNTNWRVQFLAPWKLDTKWHHFAMALPVGERTKADQLKIYLDGEPLVGRMVGAKSQIVLTAAGPVLIGVGSMRQAGHFHGIIDDVAIFPRELTAEEIASVALQGLVGARDVSPQEKLATAWGSIKAQ